MHSTIRATQPAIAQPVVACRRSRSISIKAEEQRRIKHAKRLDKQRVATKKQRTSRTYGGPQKEYITWCRETYGDDNVTPG
ncbi:hypothetical protein VTP01DRAFT_4634 [Rhizomucor pusillus]|uniref:uncharacterized protein n=1 Tax=Rhizomucor pusillus TaxID=4840 RepID=UPI0037430E09